MAVIYREDGVIWVACDRCTLTMFGGWADDSREDVIRPMQRQGWEIGKRIMCPYCREETGGDEHDEGATTH